MSRLSYIILSLFLGVVIWNFWVTDVLANQVKTDGKITGTIFIDPNDQPVTNINTTIYIAIDDRNGLFKPKDCTCVLIITHNNQEIARLTIPTTANHSDNQLSVPYLFPDLGSYTITLLGTPKMAAGFAPFTLRYMYTVKNSGITGTAESTRPTLSAKPTIVPAAQSFIQSLQQLKPFVSLFGYFIGILTLIFAFLLARSISRRMRRWG